VAAFFLKQSAHFALMLADKIDPSSLHTGMKMRELLLIASVLLTTSSMASAQDLVLTGHVQRVILQPSGSENCPPACPATSTMHPNGSQAICVSNMGGCQTMEVKVDHVYRGVAQGETRQFKSRIGEWGPSFPVTDKLIVVSEEKGNVFWSPATERDGQIFIDPKRLRRIAGVPTSTKGDTELVSLREVLARSGEVR
jgi:hypothetical protein